MKNRTLVAAMLKAGTWANPEGGDPKPTTIASYANKLITACGDDPDEDVLAGMPSALMNMPLKEH